MDGLGLIAREAERLVPEAVWSGASRLPALDPAGAPWVPIRRAIAHSAHSTESSSLHSFFSVPSAAARTVLASQSFSHLLRAHPCPFWPSPVSWCFETSLCDFQPYQTFSISYSCRVNSRAAESAASSLPQLHSLVVLHSFLYFIFPESKVELLISRTRDRYSLIGLARSMYALWRPRS